MLQNNIYQQATPFGDKGQTAGIIPSSKRFQEYPDKRRGMKWGEGRYVVHSEKEN